jgi:saccharopine dehydrogenase-like NADP-dependent oxidoreductase
MRVGMVGEDEDGETRVVTWELHDRSVDGVSSMARTTGYPCAAAVHLLASGRFSRVGVQPPEFVGGDEACFEFLLSYQHERGIVYERSSA